MCLPDSCNVDVAFLVCISFAQLSLFFQNCSSPTDVYIWTSSTKIKTS